MNKRHLLSAAVAAALTSTSALATNGMNLEGYGPISASMGGAGMAFDNGNAAMMINPATLGLSSKESRLDIAIGYLGPSVSNSMGPFTFNSTGNDYVMPAFGYTRKAGAITYGVGVFSQGGMGTEWGSGGTADGQKDRSELGVGRLIAPISFQVNESLNVGASLDYVWAQLDLMMALPVGAGFLGAPGTGGLVERCTGGYNVAPPLGPGCNFDAALGAAPPFGPGATAFRMNFSDNDNFTGSAKGSGFAGKLGFTYKLSDMATVGGSYHSKTSMDDLETTSVGTALSIMTAGGAAPMSAGKITVHDFEWPETYGLGVSVQATPQLMLAADWKRVNWSDVMANFRMTFSDANGSVTFRLPQNWDDQDVFSLGAAYQVTEKMTLRAGANIADNPIPNSTLHYLFPAMVENHYTAGMGYQFNDNQAVNLSMQFVPEVTQTNTRQGNTVRHSQTNWQIMYSHNF
jgi:long-chain fatty acid transport protein